MTRDRAVLFLALLVLGCEPGAAPTDAGRDAPRLDAGPTPPYEIADCAEAPRAGLAPLRPRCGLFADEEGRTVILRGVNARVSGLFDVTFDDGREALEPIPDFTDEDAARMRALGFDFLRLPVNWSGLEPTDETPHVYDEPYLTRLREVLDVARAHGIYVLVDWHQDAYSKEIGEDGAPLWAIEPPPTTLLGGPLEDLGDRRTSAQVIAAFATFYGDAEPGPTLRARFGEAMAHVADALRGDTIVVGFEIQNEPVATDAETRRLNEAVAAVLAGTDATRLAFFEPPAVPRNLLDEADVPRTPFASPSGVYAPHTYTLAFNGTEAQRLAFTRDTLRRSHVSARRETEAWAVPLVIGEWGYDPAGTRADEYFELQVDLFDEYLESWAFWVWKEASQGSWGVHAWDETTGAWTERANVVHALSRPRAERIAGWPRRTDFDPDTGVLTVRFRGEASITAPNEIYLPERAPGTFEVTCDGASITDLVRDAATGLVEVDCGGDGEHELLVTGLDGV